MNVGNTVMTVATVEAQPATATVGGKSAAPQQAGFGALLANELTGMLTNIQAEAAETILPGAAGESEDETDMGDLLAMLDTLLQSGMVNLIPQKAVEQALQDVQKTSTEVQNQPVVTLEASAKGELVAAFMKQGMDEQGADQIADLLERLVKSQAADQQPQVKQAVQQALAILEKYGVEVQQAVQPESVKKETEISFSSVKKSGAGNRIEMRNAALPHFQSALQSNLLPHQVHVALAKYQPGLVIRQDQPQTQLDQLLQASMQNVTEAASLTGDDTQVSNTFAGSLQSTMQTQAQPAGTQAAQPTGELVRSEQLPKDMANLFVKQMKIVGANGMSEAKLTLHPQALGQVDVKITANNHVITAQFAADTHAGKELLDNQLPQLRAALTQLGLQVDRLEVTQQQSSQQPQFGFQQQREGQQNQQREQQKRSKDEDAEFNIEALTESNGVDSWLSAKQAKVEYSV